MSTVFKWYINSENQLGIISTDGVTIQAPQSANKIIRVHYIKRAQTITDTEGELEIKPNYHYALLHGVIAHTAELLGKESNLSRSLFEKGKRDAKTEVSKGLRRFKTLVGYNI